MSKNARRWLIIGIIAAVVLVGGSAIGVAIGQANKEAAIAEEEQRQQEEQDREEADAIAAQEAEDEDEREFRREQVAFIESRIQSMAEEHAAEGYIDGPIIDVSCAPTNGGSTDDLTAKTTVFECFVANEDNGDGTMRGHYYNATMNWTDGTFTYGMGRA
ncbi:DUF2510 domain-containing protein [Gulosibacter chungangensis]|nr:DUF2510 domain-containing protein [Gulosibacter chungangensis]